jgi:hypothetical protein
MSSKAGTMFMSADSAAIAAIEEINGISIKRNVEFAGRIVRLGSGFTFTQARTLNQRDNSNPGPKTPDSVGAYHTHSGEFERSDEVFSAGDKGKATLGKELSYVGTPRGRILKFTPIDLLSDLEQGFNASGLVETVRGAAYNEAHERGRLLGRWKVDRPNTHDTWDAVFFSDSTAVWTQGTGDDRFASLGQGMWWIQNDEIVVMWRADLQEFWPLPLRTQKEVAQENPGNRLVAKKIEDEANNPQSKFSIST